MKKCITGKRTFSTAEQAEGALLEAYMRFDYAEGRGPVAIYRCDDCGEFHLTSKGPMNEKLSVYLASSKLKRDKQAHEWMEKLKRKSKG
jgi:hypothetical protein